jgi:hypothetical protein
MKKVQGKLNWDLKPKDPEGHIPRIKKNQLFSKAMQKYFISVFLSFAIINRI